MDTLENLDEFESIFRKAARPRFEYLPITMERATIVTDTNDSSLQQIEQQLQSFSPMLQQVKHWSQVVLGQSSTVNEMQQKLDELAADIVISWRHLCEADHQPHHSLGIFVDVLTQSRQEPVLLLPGTASTPAGLNEQACQHVVVVTDHLSGDHRLVNTAAALINPNGRLTLGHVEDDLVYARYLSAIERIPEISTEKIREKLLPQLLHDVELYCGSVQEILSQKSPSLQVDSSIQVGHQMQTLKALVEKEQADCLVMNTKEEDQVAMHGLAYSLSLELTDRPLLML